ncbi:MAG TPA: alpha-L-fucosidase [Pirellulales bacterium]
MTNRLRVHTALAAIAFLFICLSVVVLVRAQDTQPAAGDSKQSDKSKDAGKSSANSPAKKSNGKKSTASKAKSKDEEDVAAEHDTIGVETKAGNFPHTTHPGAQWYPKAGLGLFIHWGLASVRASNISWPMIPGRPLAAKQITDPDEQQRIIREGDYNLNGKPLEITPDNYWSVAPQFNPQDYDPNKWLKAAKAAGFEYAVLTAKHHEGFALWPSAYGDFNTKNYMSGRDLVKEYVEACRKNGLKVGLYFSGPDWHFDRDYMSFLYHANQTPWMPSLGPDLKPRTEKKTPEEIAAHQKQFTELVRGQIEELLTNYGQIDLIWFDGKPAVPHADSVITIDRIRELQPQIVINPRLHGHGDFVTYERKLATDEPATGWAEFCNTWTNSWSHQNLPFRSDGFVLGQLVKCRSLGVNYLLGVGPTKDGVFVDDIYKNMAVVGEWMAKNRASIDGTTPLANRESASVPATAGKNVRYLFAIPQFKNDGMFDKDMLPRETMTLELKGAPAPKAVKLLADGSALEHSVKDGTLSITLPAEKRTKLVDVVEVDLAE